MTKDNWNELIAQAWDDETLTDEERILLIDKIAQTRPSRDAQAMFERAGARDAAGREEEAIPLYRAAIAEGLSEFERVQAVIQLASSYRNVGVPDLAVSSLTQELANPAAALREEVTVFLALSLYTAGQHGQALALLMRQLEPGLQMYRRSVRAYADELDEEPAMPTANTGETA